MLDEGSMDYLATLTYFHTIVEDIESFQSYKKRNTCAKNLRFIKDPKLKGSRAKGVTRWPKTLFFFQFLASHKFHYHSTYHNSI